VSIAIDCKDTTERECLPSQREIQILARRIAVDFNGHALLSGGLEHDVPVRNNTGMRSGNAAAWVGENSNRRVLNVAPRLRPSTCPRRC
jgi:hypothetical protein